MLLLSVAWLDGGRAMGCGSRRRRRGSTGRSLACRARSTVTGSASGRSSVTALVSWPKPTPGARDVVGDDEIEVLGAELGRGVGHRSVGLGGEADEHLARALGGAEPGEDVGRRLEDDLGHAVVLLELAGGGRLGPEVGDGGGHHDDVGARRPRPRRRPASRPPSRRRRRARRAAPGGRRCEIEHDVGARARRPRRRRRSPACPSCGWRSRARRRSARGCRRR